MSTLDSSLLIHHIIKTRNATSDKRKESEESKRRDDLVRQMVDAHEYEMKAVNERMETLRVSALHAQQFMACAHQATKHELLLAQNALHHQNRQNILQNAALVQARSAEKLCKSNHAALVAKLDQVQAELIETQSRDNEMIADLKDKVSRQERSNTEVLTALDAVKEALRLQLNEEKRARREAELELERVKEQLTTRETDAVKQCKRQIQELDVALSRDQRHISRLQTAKAELEVERSALIARKRRIEAEDASSETVQSKKRSRGEQEGVIQSPSVLIKREESETEAWLKAPKPTGSLLVHAGTSQSRAPHECKRERGEE
ncbi:hypothetical protein M408DRAFT_24634 [Serendipita vermifera MAFF 305830]|uniref:Uncharacterized protein n=1 Tax=Serendipita vermifera MAFF 305830 TaxID=933852 RepID=A0A0C2XE86_SERVB|nr:hypothetical protein M408DRAFT_24634 [Serendipita vermifera MAFF 305830]